MVLERGAADDVQDVVDASAFRQLEHRRERRQRARKADRHRVERALGGGIGHGRADARHPGDGRHIQHGRGPAGLTVGFDQQRGDIALEEATRARSRIDVVVVQTPSLRYGRDYFLGDLVSISVDGVLYTRKIASVAIRVGTDGSENIDVGLISQ